MVPFSHIDTLLFDLDGTLIDSSKGVVECFNYVFDRIGVSRPPSAAIIETIGYPLDQAFARFTDHDPGRCYDLFQIKAREVMVDSAVLLDGVRETLSDLQAKGYTLGIASTKRSEHIAGILERLGVISTIKTWSGSDEVARVKPDPEILHLTLQKLGGEAAHSAYVGDTSLDVLAARSAGIVSVAVLGGTGTREELIAHKPDLLVERFKDLIDLFSFKGDQE